MTAVPVGEVDSIRSPDSPFNSIISKPTATVVDESPLMENTLSDSNFKPNATIDKTDTITRKAPCQMYVFCGSNSVIKFLCSNMDFINAFYWDV
jgi:hypothetical protein